MMTAQKRLHMEKYVADFIMQAHVADLESEIMTVKKRFRFAKEQMLSTLKKFSRT